MEDNNKTPDHSTSKLGIYPDNVIRGNEKILVGEFGCVIGMIDLPTDIYDDLEMFLENKRRYYLSKIKLREGQKIIFNLFYYKRGKKHQLEAIITDINGQIDFCADPNPSIWELLA